mmetsp:Transcript_26127/g.46461  ORF Transcript_26127/g.46461 Transcript_26127/m.46461 type:complete len:186 (-) Transcript_26127:34-591(-)
MAKLTGSKRPSTKIRKLRNEELGRTYQWNGPQERRTGRRPEWTDDIDQIPRLLERIKIEPGLSVKLFKPPRVEKLERLGGRLAEQARCQTLELLNDLDDFMRDQEFESIRVTSEAKIMVDNELRKSIRRVFMKEPLPPTMTARSSRTGSYGGTLSTIQPNPLQQAGQFVADTQRLTRRQLMYESE